MSTSIDDLDFPKAVLTRMIKSSLPENIAIQKEARNAVSKATVVFVSYLAATANDCAREAGHKTIMPVDVKKALEAVGLADFIDRLSEELEAHTKIIKEKKELAAKNKISGGDGDDVGDDGEQEIEEDEDAAASAEEEMDEDDVSTKDEHEQNDVAADVPSKQNITGNGDANTPAQKTPAEVTASDAAATPVPESESMDIDDPNAEQAKRQRVE
ncbi:histone-fold-containing protein [Coemansia reversa NRRL 1564]|uniref:DNA polymerase epsilon subunit D n=1 Tax=Coemansia reversa (strain ATCC 12441 / NRRL 1564) TaxID=763665 RepID=A0A2G5B500_COERN|nr:histone-fold-containing protein [Coemansia reversa NRRL 1564]|eukprot:PIA14123.1 histone-fold-containing protein [Coemansia reversa NRRL 1564]